MYHQVNAAKDNFQDEEHQHQDDDKIITTTKDDDEGTAVVVAAPSTTTTTTTTTQQNVDINKPLHSHSTPTPCDTSSTPAAVTETSTHREQQNVSSHHDHDDDDHHHNNNHQHSPSSSSSVLNPCWTGITEGIVNRYLRSFVVSLSTYAARYPVGCVVGITILSFALVVIGFVTNFNMEFDQLVFLTPQNSLPDIHADWINSPNSGFEPIRVFWFSLHNHGNNIIHTQAIRQAFIVMDTVTTAPNFQTVCSKSKNYLNLKTYKPTCRILSVTDFWDRNQTLFENQISDIPIQYQDYYVQQIVSGSEFPDGTPVFHEAILGNHNNVTISSWLLDRWLITSAQSLVFKVDIPDIGYETDILQKQLLNRLGALQLQWINENENDDNKNNVKLEYYTLEAYQQEFQRALNRDLPLVVVLCVVMVSFTCFVFYRHNEKVQSRGMVGIFSFISIGMSLLTGYGIMFLVGVPLTSVGIMIPFVVVGVGLDDTFIITGAYFRRRQQVQKQKLLHQPHHHHHNNDDSSIRNSNETLAVADDEGNHNNDNDGHNKNKNHNKNNINDNTIVEIIRETMDEVGVSISMTTITTLLCFLVGSASSIPAVKWLCYYAATALFIVYIYQITYFIALLVIDERRVKANRRDLCFWVIVTSDRGGDDWNINSSSIDGHTDEEQYVLSDSPKSSYDTGDNNSNNKNNNVHDDGNNDDDDNDSSNNNLHHNKQPILEAEDNNRTENTDTTPARQETAVDTSITYDDDVNVNVNALNNDNDKGLIIMNLEEDLTTTGSCKSGSNNDNNNDVMEHEINSSNESVYLDDDDNNNNNDTTSGKYNNKIIIDSDGDNSTNVDETIKQIAMEENDNEHGDDDAKNQKIIQTNNDAAEVNSNNTSNTTLQSDNTTDSTSGTDQSTNDDDGGDDDNNNKTTDDDNSGSAKEEEDDDDDDHDEQNSNLSNEPPGSRLGGHDENGTPILIPIDASDFTAPSASAASENDLPQITTTDPPHVPPSSGDDDDKSNENENNNYESSMNNVVMMQLGPSIDSIIDQEQPTIGNIDIEPDDDNNNEKKNALIKVKFKKSNDNESNEFFNDEPMEVAPLLTSSNSKSLSHGGKTTKMTATCSNNNNYEKMMMMKKNIEKGDNDSSTTNNIHQHDDDDDDNNDNNDNKNFMERLMSWYATKLLKPWSKVIVIIVFAIYFFGCIYSTTLLYQEFNVADYVPEDSFLTSFVSTFEEYVSLRRFIGVYFRNVDQSNPNIQRQMREFVKELSELPQIGEPPAFFWVRDFEKLANSDEVVNMGFDLSDMSFNDQIELALSIPQVRQIYGQDIVRDEVTGDITASRTFLYLRNLNMYDIQNQIDILMDQREITKEQPINSKVTETTSNDGFSFFSFDELYFFWELYSITMDELRFTTISCVIIVTFVGFVLIPHWSAMAFVTPLLIVLYFYLLGTMQYLGIKINNITYFIIVMAIGLLVDFLMHVLLRYYESKGKTRHEKVQDTLETMGVSILLGGFTTWLGVIPLAFSTTKVFMTVFKSFLAMVTLGCAVGLVLLPVLLSIVGPVQEENSTTIPNPTAPTLPNNSTATIPHHGTDHLKEEQLPVLSAAKTTIRTTTTPGGTQDSIVYNQLVDVEL